MCQPHPAGVFGLLLALRKQDPSVQAEIIVLWIGSRGWLCKGGGIGGGLRVYSSLSVEMNWEVSHFKKSFARLRML